MYSGTFSLTIKLGNAEMSGYDDIARALRIVADKVDKFQDDGIVRDDNGNTVGSFQVRA